MARILARIKATQKPELPFTAPVISDVIDVFGPALSTNAPAFVRLGP
jgi:hypothetical protein